MGCGELSLTWVAMGADGWAAVVVDVVTISQCSQPLVQSRWVMLISRGDSSCCLDFRRPVVGKFASRTPFVIVLIATAGADATIFRDVSVLSVAVEKTG